MRPGPTPLFFCLFHTHTQASDLLGLKCRFIFCLLYRYPILQTHSLGKLRMSGHCGLQGNGWDRTASKEQAAEALRDPLKALREKPEAQNRSERA